MAKEARINITAKNKATKEIKSVKKGLEDLGKKGKDAGKKISDGTKKSINGLNKMGNKLRFLSLVMTAVAAASVGLAKSFVDSYVEMEQAMLKVSAFAVAFGEDMGEVQKAAKKLAMETGIVSVTNAAAGLANLLATGIGLDKAEKLFRRMVDTSYLAKESISDTADEAAVKGTLGFRIFQERMVDATGINFLMIKVLREYANTIDKTYESLTNAEKYQGLYNFYMKESEFATGAASLAAETFGGALGRLKTSAEIMKASLGAALIPTIGILADILYWTTKKVTEFAEKFPALFNIIMVGTIVVTALITVLTMLGAVVPLITGFITTLINVFAGLNMTVAITAIEFAGIAIAVGLLGYLILKVTGYWDKWSDSMKNLTKKIGETINEMSGLGDTTEESAEQADKSLAKVQKRIDLVWRDYYDSLAEWLKKHNEMVVDIGVDLGNLSRDYEKALDKINKNYNRSMTDLSIAHARKTEDLQRDIDEEISKGIWADQTRIRLLKLQLKRENEDYARQSKKLNEDRDEDLKNEKERHDEKFNELSTKLNEEMAMYVKHYDQLKVVKDRYVLDEIDKIERRRKDRLEEFDEEKRGYQEIIDKYEEMKGKSEDFNYTIKDALNHTDRHSKKVQELAGEYKAAKEAADKLNTAGVFGLAISKLQENTAKENIESGVGFLKEMANKIWSYVDSSSAKVSEKARELREKESRTGEISSWAEELNKSISERMPAYQQGGVIPGRPDQSMPILAHGGETVLPAGVNPINININNPTVRSDTDIQKIADAVQQVLSRRQQLRHYK